MENLIRTNHKIKIKQVYSLKVYINVMFPFSIFDLGSHLL